jgi:hypothetical protein
MAAGKAMSCVNNACCSTPGTPGCKGDRLCTTGYTGYLCAQCEDGYGQAGQHACAACPADPTQTDLVLAGTSFAMLGFAVLLTFLAYRSSRRQVKKHQEAVQQGQQAKASSTNGLALMSMGIGFVTTSISALALGFELPAPVRRVLESQSSVFNAGNDFPAFACKVLQLGGLHRYVFSAGLTLWGCMPLVSGSIGLLSLGLFSGASKLCASKTASATATSVSPRGSVFASAQKDRKDAKDAKATSGLRKMGSWQWFVHVYVIGCSCVFFNMYSTIATMAFRAFPCGEVGPGNFLLLSDRSVECYTAEYSSTRVVACLLIAVYVVGAPLAALAYLRRNHQPGNHLSFLLEGLKPSKYYWFIVTTARKVPFLPIPLHFLGSFKPLCLHLLLTLCLLLFC